MNDSHVTVLPDGRELGWLEFGEPNGTPIFAFHGTPGSRYQIVMDDESISDAGLRFICVDRPGYGLSSFQRGHRLVDWPKDVAHLASKLGIEKFAVLGHSGGGPFAVVCAALLSERVSAAAIVSGVGPLDGPHAFDSMKKSEQIQMKLSRRRSRIMRAACISQMEVFRKRPSWALNMMTKQFASVDRAILARANVRTVMQSEATRLSRTTGRAVAQDLEIFTVDWGFDLSAITVPVQIWQGDEDLSVPPAHARTMHEAIPGSVLHEIPGAGHFFMFERLGEIGLALTQG
jgi:pimeloyl-ACP methyl ester carboxylesterase